MPRGPSARTGTLWRKRWERFSRSGLSVGQFCSREGVSTSSLYNWRRKLAQVVPAFPEVEPRDGSFQPVTVVPSPPGVAIQLPGGARIEIDPGQLDTIRTVVAEVVRVADHHHGRVAPC